MPDDVGHLDDACPNGEHNIGRDGEGMLRCSKCKISLQTLVDSMDHDVS